MNMTTPTRTADFQPLRRAGLCVAFVALAALAACDTPSKLNNPNSLAPVETRTTSAGAATSAASNTAATAAAQSSVPTVDLNAGGAAGAATAAMSATAQRVVYFDYDSFAIRDDAKPVIDSYAKLLASTRNKRLVVEGHTDQRGGREYNLALGQKRAAAVVSSLTLLGATEGQLEAVSFGQERPAATGNDESAWAKNRRAEIRDR